MFRLFTFFLFLFSFDSLALHTFASAHNPPLSSLYCTTSHPSTCSLPPETVTKYYSNGKTFQRCEANGKYTFERGRLYMNFTCFSEWAGIPDSDVNRKYTIQLGGSDGCNTSEECFLLAKEDCKSQSKDLENYTFVGPNDYTHSCGTAPNPAQECEDRITAQCANNYGLGSSTYSDDGLGNFSCTGTCTDGTAAEDNCIETRENNYCDIVEPPSELDFSAGGTGSSVDPSTTTTEDTEHDVDYEADGSSLDPTAPFSSIQGDKLINEITATRNDNTKNLASTTETTNETIIEKSDDVSQTISNSANGVIDAINNITPFNDYGIVQGMEQFSVKVDNLADILGNLKEDVATGVGEGVSEGLGGDFVSGSTSADFSAYDTLFGDDSIAQLTELTETLKVSIETENGLFKSSLMDHLSFTSVNGGEYEQKNLDLSSWGSHDISMSRFSTFFGGLGNIIYFLAALTALTIVLGGFKS